jgi:hypothetical protein
MKMEGEGRGSFNRFESVYCNVMWLLRNQTPLNLCDWLWSLGAVSLQKIHRKSETFP